MVVFKILNKITGQHYVGSCRGDIYERWALYVRAAEAGLDYPLYHEIREQGESSFSITELDYADSIEELKEMELLHTIELIARSLRAYKFGVKDAVVKRCSKLDLDRAWMKDLQEEISQAHGDDEIPVPRTPAAGQPATGAVTAKRPLQSGRSVVAAAKKKLTPGKKKPAQPSRSVAKADPAAALLAQAAAEKQAYDAEQAAKKAAFPAKLAALSRAVKADTDWESALKKQQVSKTAPVSSTEGSGETPCTPPVAERAPTLTAIAKRSDQEVTSHDGGVAALSPTTCDDSPSLACDRSTPSGSAVQKGSVSKGEESQPNVSLNVAAVIEPATLSVSVSSAPDDTAAAATAAALRASAEVPVEQLNDEKAVLAEGIALLVRTLGSAEQMSRVQQEVQQQSHQMSQALSVSAQSMLQLQQLQQQAAQQSQKALEAVTASLAANDALAQAQQQAQQSVDRLVQSLRPADETATLVTQLQEELGALLAKLKRVQPCAKRRSEAAHESAREVVIKPQVTASATGKKTAVSPPASQRDLVVEKVVERAVESAVETTHELKESALLQERDSVIAAQEKIMVNRLQQLGTLMSSQKGTDTMTSASPDSFEPLEASADRNKTKPGSDEPGSDEAVAKSSAKSAVAPQVNLPAGETPREQLPDLQARAWVAPAKGGGQGPRLLEKTTPVATIVRRRSRSPAPLPRRADRSRQSVAGSGLPMAAGGSSASAPAQSAATAKMSDRPVLSRKTLGLKNRV